MEEENIDVKDTQRFLPIGTIVLLKGATKRLMISGYCAVDQEKKDEMWDYSGCMYPEGFLSSTQSFLFDHSQIAKIYSLGYKDSEEEEFQQRLNNYINSKKSEDGSDSEDSNSGDGSVSASEEVNNVSNNDESIQEDETEETFNNQLLNNSENVEVIQTEDNNSNIEEIVNTAIEDTTVAETPMVEESPVVNDEVSSAPVVEEMPVDSEIVSAPNPEPVAIPIDENILEQTVTPVDASTTESVASPIEEGGTEPVVTPIEENSTETEAIPVDENVVEQVIGVTSESEIPSVQQIVGNVDIQGTESTSSESEPVSTNPSAAPNPNNAADLSEFDQWLNQTGPYANDNNNNNQ